MNHLLGGTPMLSDNDFMAYFTGIGISGPHLSRKVDILQRAQADVSEFIDPSMGGQQFLASS